MKMHFLIIAALALLQISCTDGKFKVTEPGKVELKSSAATVGSITLNWNAPATNDDNSTLTDLAKYKIHYGTVSGAYTNVIEVVNATSYTIANLPLKSTYYFTVSAVNSTGDESPLSAEMSKAL
jgi:hypothetical protein